MGKTIGILTSGGDSPGMNAAIWATVKAARGRGIRVLGVNHGYQGLITGDAQELSCDDVAGILNQGGTVLKTARCLKMKTEEGRAEAAEMARRLGLEGLIVVGGDGSYHGAAILAERGIPTIALPGTIDNDLPYTDMTLGFETACVAAYEATLQIKDTMVSHGRVGIVEVMGRYCGDIALEVALATGADYVLVPEVTYDSPFDVPALADRLIRLKDQGQESFLIILAEGVGYEIPNRAQELRHLLEEELKRRGRTVGDVRETVLGYLQRGGQPTPDDINLSVRMASHAVDLLANGIGNRAVGVRSNAIFDIDIKEALQAPRMFRKELYDLAHRLAFADAGGGRE